MKKISTLFKKDPNDLSRVINEVDPQNQWVIDGEGIATRKWDGIACAIIDGKLYKRRDVKKGRTVPPNAIPCCDPDPITGHWPHWMLCDRSNPDDALFFEGFDRLIEPYDATYELCGEKISTERFEKNFNPENIKGHEMIEHGIGRIPVNRTYAGIMNYLAQADIEGIVFHHPDGRMCKIRKKDFGIKR